MTGPGITAGACAMFYGTLNSHYLYQLTPVKLCSTIDGMTHNLPAPVAPQSHQIVTPGVMLNPVALLLQDKRKLTTRRAYRQDLDQFFRQDAGAAAVHAFLALPVPEIALRLAQWRAEMLSRGLSAATINRRLAAVKSLLKFSFRLGYCQTDGRGLVDGERVEPYRDTRGTDLANLKRLLVVPDRTTVRGGRDFALLRLLIDNALRRAEVCALDMADFQPAERRLFILGKGRTEKESVTLSPATVRAIQVYLALAGHCEGALFRSCDRRAQGAGARLTVDGLHAMVQARGRQCGLVLTPHKLRHSAITAALEATGGDVRRVQKLSRHKKLETLMIYDDARADHQGEITQLLGDLLDN